MLHRLVSPLVLVMLPAAVIAAETGRAGNGAGEDRAPVAEVTPQEPDFDATDPEAVTAMMRDYGIRAALGKTEAGNPVIESRVSRADFSIIFYGCTRDRDCAQAVFTTSWTLDGTDRALQVANTWNNGKILGRAWVDEDNELIGLDHTVFLRNLSREIMDDTLTAWGDIVEEFWTTLYEKLWNGEEPDSYNASSRNI